MAARSSSNPVAKLQQKPNDLTMNAASRPTTPPPPPPSPYANIVDAKKEKKRRRRRRKKKRSKTLTDNAQATVEGHSGPTQCSAEI